MEQYVHFHCFGGNITAFYKVDKEEVVTPNSVVCRSTFQISFYIKASTMQSLLMEGENATNKVMDHANISIVKL